MSVPIHRRTFVTSCALSAAGIATGVPASAFALDTRTRSRATPGSSNSEGTFRDPRMRGLVNRALDAAQSVGAQYADVRATYTRGRVIAGGSESARDSIQIILSVRALVRGNWGVAATPLLTGDEMSRVGRTAATNAQALANIGRDRLVEWVPIATVQDGDWTTPIEVDPFTVPIREVAAFLDGEYQYSKLRPGVSWNGQAGLTAVFEKQDRVFASTEGSYGIQTFYTTSCGATLQSARGGAAPFQNPNEAQAGWEHVRDQPWRTVIPELLDQIDVDLKLPVDRPVEVGRYDVVFGAGAMASLIAATVGSATSLGRALGYEANLLGTSYLGPDVLAMLGTSVASPLLSIQANRSRPKALATVKWDDEGVTPEDFPLITDGRLVDYLTMREQAPWLKEWYAKQKEPVRSRGCASSRSADAVLRENIPNLDMRAATTDRSFDDLVTDVGNGVAIQTLGAARMDWQCLNGLAYVNQCYRIRGGKRVARLGFMGQSGSGGANAIMFRAPELLKGIVAIGGKSSTLWTNQVGADLHKYSLGAVPAAVKQMTFIDQSRRA